MNSLLKKKKGFTLIELLAVIIILGILMIIAIPSVTQYIQSSRKETYASNAKRYIDGAKNIVNSGEMELYDPETTYYVPISCVPLEKGGGSPFGEFDPAYVVVTYEGDSYDYYFTGTDTSKMGIYLTHESLLTKDLIKSNVNSIDTTIGVGERENIIKLDDSCDPETVEPYLATSFIEEKGSLTVTDESQTGSNDSPKALYAVLSKNAVADNIATTNVTSSTGINFDSSSGSSNGLGVYSNSKVPTDGNKTIYYFRGNVDNNNVIFAGFCWKIIRTTETGGIKILYNGVATNNNCQSPGNNNIGRYSFNKSYEYITYSGYMYDDIQIKPVNKSMTSFSSEIFANDVEYNTTTKKYTLKDSATYSGAWSDNYYDVYRDKKHYTCFNNTTSCDEVYYVTYTSSNSVYYILLNNGEKINTFLEKVTTKSNNTISSNAKNEIDKWYVANLSNYENRLEDTIWCADRTVGKFDSWDKDSTYFQGNGSFGYSGDKRIYSYPKSPDLRCPNPNDRFTTSTKNGNGKLEYPVGLLTADEITMYDDQKSLGWTMTPSYYSGFSSSGFVYNGYGVSYGNITNTEFIRPAISLKSGTQFTEGEGTLEKPYIIE